MKILLSGGSGFLGSALARRWAGAGHLLCLPLRRTSTLDRLGDALGSVAVARFGTDDELRGIVASFAPDVVVHTACTYGRQGEPAVQIFDTNVRLGMLLVESALATGPRPIRVINTGTVLADNVSLYALSKQQFSAWGRWMAQASPTALQFIDVKLQHMYGPGDDERKFSTHVLRSLRRNVPSLALTDGRQRRDFIYIDDVVQAYDVMLNGLASLDVAEAVDVGSGVAPTIREFVELVGTLAGSTTQLKFGAIATRSAEPELCIADTNRLRALGWQAHYTLLEGLRKTIELES